MYILGDDARVRVLVYIAAGVPLVRRGLPWNPDAEAEEGQVARRRLERNSGLICRLLYHGLVQRGEMEKGGEAAA